MDDDEQPAAGVDDHAPLPLPGEAVDGARRALRRAGGILRSASDAIGERGGIEPIRVKMERAGQQLERAEAALANATAIEGTVVEPATPSESVQLDEQPATADASARRDRLPGWVLAGLFAAAATYGALRLQARSD